MDRIEGNNNVMPGKITNLRNGGLGHRAFPPPGLPPPFRSLSGLEGKGEEEVGHAHRSERNANSYIIRKIHGTGLSPEPEEKPEKGGFSGADGFPSEVG
ncbi:hypothetical protein ZHAS_00008052 [Anopheles sinensis]|uniref:Uncharacterized protein n=1 Tax=Anopheles sinensis TaxID=74873 RepID=A0A084VRG2_ANOSI|nr:hypothetical protein ZHAS_00008052 [Anopheles sinensis]